MNPAHWIVILATIVVISLIVGLHYEVLRHCIRLLPTVAHRRRQRVVVLILVILATHAAEVWIFGIAYYVLAHWDSLGTLAGTAPVTDILDYVYYSAMVYTTVGFGDIYPEGAIRFMSGMEAVTGLVMITWSASFTFIEMQRDWKVGRD